MLGLKLFLIVLLCGCGRSLGRTHITVCWRSPTEGMGDYGGSWGAKQGGEGRGRKPRKLRGEGIAAMGDRQPDSTNEFVKSIQVLNENIF